MNISTEQYFAAHAPELPAWFTHVEREVKIPDITPRTYGVTNNIDACLLDAWRKDPCFDIDEERLHDRTPENIQACDKFVRTWNQFWKDRHEAEKTNKIEAFFAWREFYGREMARRMTATEQRTEDKTNG
jgi:hypothetical protein